RIPYPVAHWTGLLLEILGHVVGSQRPPRLTRYAVSLVGRPTRFSSARAHTQLGWRPRVGPEEGLRRTPGWDRPGGTPGPFRDPPRKGTGPRAAGSDARADCESRNGEAV